LPAPVLSDGSYRDRPTPRPDDWSGLVSQRDARLDLKAEAPRDDDGGLQQQRAPDLAQDSAPPVVEPDKPDLGGDDDGDITADSRAMAAAQTASTVVRAHAINEGSDREESLPSFWTASGTSCSCQRT
jgi:type IV secretion system protein VirD4